jgi:glc operon protein GlcG
MVHSIRNSSRQQTYTRTVETIASDAASEGIQIGSALGKQHNLNLSIAICDQSMSLRAYIHMDNATPHSAETSKRKAQTAASTRRATGWMGPDLAITLPMAAGNLLTNVGGGLPIRFDGIFVGAIGVAGGTVEQDIEIAKAILKEMGADPAE